MKTPVTPPGGINPAANPFADGSRGAMRQADNVVLPALDKMEPRRGGSLSTYATSVAATRCAEFYNDTLLVASATTLERDTGSAFSTVASFTSFGAGQRMRFLGGQGKEIDGNLYYTTPEGVLALDSVTGTSRVAGIPRPGDFYTYQTSINFTGLTGNVNAGWLAKDRAVAYRAVFGRRDANNNFHLSAPSGRTVIINPADVTVAIGGLVRDTGTTVATVTSHGFRYGDIVSLTLSGGDVGNFATSNNLISSTPPSGLTPTQFWWAEASPNYTNVAEVVITSGSKNILLAVDIPAEIIAGDFVQIYRTLSVSGATTDPGDECYLAYERVLTATDISNTYASITDTTPDAFLGQPLYTNANTGNPEQENSRPPLATDLALFDSRAWYINTTDRHRLNFRLLGTGSTVSGLQSNDIIAINTRAFVANADFGASTEYDAATNIFRTIQSFVTASTYQGLNLAWKTYATHDGDNGTGGVLVEERGLGGSFPESANSASNPTAIYAGTSRPSAFAEQLATVIEVTEASSSRTGSTVTITTASAHGFVPGQVVMLAYRASTSVDANFPPGLKTIATTPLSTTFTYTESGAAATMTGTYYVYAATFKSVADTKPLVFSKPGEPHAVPLLNYIQDIPRGQTVLRAAPLRGSLYVFLANGDIWTVSGTYPYRVEKFDGTATLIAADSLVEHSNRLYGLTTQGLCAISEAGVEVVSPQLEPDLWPLIAAEATAGTLGNIRACSYESERQYRLYLSSTSGNLVYIYNSLYRRWTRQTAETLLGRSWGVVRRSTNKLYEGHATLGRVWLERKAYTRLDFVDSTGTFTASSLSAESITAATAFASQVLTGDVVSASDSGLTYYWLVTSVTGSVGSQTVVGSQATYGSTGFDLGDFASSVPAAVYTVYRPFTSTMQWMHDAGGDPSADKNFREAMLHFSRYSVNTATATYTAIDGSTAATATITAAAPQAYSFSEPTLPISKRAQVDDVTQYVTTTPQLALGLTISEPFAVWTLLGYTMTAEAGGDVVT